MSHWW